MKIFWFLILVGADLIGTLSVSEETPCAPRWQDEGPGYVCVCNSSYCDTMDDPQELSSGSYHFYKTSNSTPGFTRSTGKFLRGRTPIAKNDVVFTINFSVHYQEITGFGGAVTDTSCINVYSLPETTQEKLIESYFGPSGIGYTMLRLPIGGTDFSIRSYTLDDVTDDNDLEHFSLADEDLNMKIPFIKKAMNVSGRDIKLMSCPFKSPSWMKVKAEGLSYLRENMTKVWAKYHLKFLEAYREQGLEIWSVSGRNEGVLPLLLTAIANSDLVVEFAHEQRKWFTDDLKPLLVASNFSDVKLIAMEDIPTNAIYWLKRFDLDKKAYDELDGIAIHWYADYFIPLSTILEKLHEKYPDKTLMYTEACCNGVCGQDPVVLGSWYRGEAYSYDIMKTLNLWSSTFVDWNLALNLTGGPTMGYGIEAPVIVNETSGEFYKQPMFYSMGHFSKFVQPGARRVQVSATESLKRNTHSVSNKTLDMNAFSSAQKAGLGAPYDYYISVPQEVNCLAAINPDNSTTVIVLNTMDAAASVRIVDPRLGFILLEAEEHSINTFVYWP